MTVRAVPARLHDETGELDPRVSGGQRRGAICGPASKAPHTHRYQVTAAGRLAITAQIAPVWPNSPGSPHEIFPQKQESRH